MKNINKTTIITSIGSLVIGLLLGWLFFQHSEETKIEEHDHILESNTEMTWTCSMHPQIRKNEPGKCPICGMDLIPLAIDDGNVDARAITMSPTAMQLAQVETMIVGKGEVSKSVRLNGKVQPDERLLFTQSSHIPGRVEKLMVNFTGEYVMQGQIIAYLYSPDLVTAQQELFEARKIKDTQPELFIAAKEKLKNWKLTKNQIDKILVSDKAIEQFPILANVSGYITRKMVNPGDYIKQGQSLYEIANLSKVWVLFDIYETDMIWVKKGAEISYTIQSLPGKSFKGKISYIDPVIDLKTRVAKARLDVINKDLSLKPEMFASGTLIGNVNNNESSIIIPKSAVMWTGKRSVVYIMQKSVQDVSFMMREVTLGPALGEGYIIESGLEPGEEIAVNGTFSIDAAAQLAGKPSMMNPTGGAAMTGHNHDQVSNEIDPIESKPTQGKKIQLIKINQMSKDALKPLYIHYLHLKDALVKSNFAEAKGIALELKSSLEEVDMSLFKEEAHYTWMQQSEQLESILTHAEHWTGVNDIRTAFISLSSTMIGLTKTFNPFGKKLFVQYCPMANNNAGANWLSLEEEIRNPYFGDTMLTCGNVEEELY